MIVMVLIKVTDSSVVYSYQPGGKGKPGTVEYNSKTKRAVVTETAEDSYQYDAWKSCNKVERLVEERGVNGLPSRCLVAWH